MELPARKGAYVDILLPIVAQERQGFDAELALGRQGALKETRAYWNKITACPTTFEVPEKEDQ